ncbi:hypothetical protein AIOL_000170 [Candidatus Rhodobacter oscarellae]|uniref:Uncharacterized protein n=1 Tax=Candidatus Rhodobacter oscarellae TaxID=1675527 RepID=A0A0J9EB62_9RHOB|nr:hypothetical protein [Candidatus Rhodobacter lobularis]KMW60020.1 hypothetical protein AIOL_000170 [Candidatus Rhodobacter lobularis]
MRLTQHLMRLTQAVALGGLIASAAQAGILDNRAGKALAPGGKKAVKIVPPPGLLLPNCPKGWKLTKASKTVYHCGIKLEGSLNPGAGNPGNLHNFPQLMQAAETTACHSPHYWNVGPMIYTPGPGAVRWECQHK